MQSQDQSASIISLDDKVDKELNINEHQQQDLNLSIHSHKTNSHEGNSSLMKKSITNSSYQKRRLSINQKYEEVQISGYQDCDDSSSLNHNHSSKIKPTRQFIDEEEAKTW
jgi:hypothetical protein